MLGRGGLSVAEGRFIRLVQKARWWNKLKASDGKISWVHLSSVQFCLCVWILCTVCDWKFYELSRLWPLAGRAGQDKWPLKGWVSLTTVPFHLITHHLVEAKSNMRGNINPILWTRQKDKGRTDQKDKNTKRKKEGRVQRQIRKKTSLIYANPRENWSEVAWCNVDLSSLFQGKIREKK